jgi:hypothetical protein
MIEDKKKWKPVSHILILGSKWLFYCKRKLICKRKEGLKNEIEFHETSFLDEMSFGEWNGFCFLKVIRWGYFLVSAFLHHTTHASHTTHTAHATHGRCLVLRSIDNHAFSGGKEGSNARGINKSSSDDLGRIKNTFLDHINVFVLGSIVTIVEVIDVLFQELTSNNGTFAASVVNNGSAWALDSLANDVDTQLLVKVDSLNLIESLGSLEKSGTTSRDNTFLNGSASGAKSIVKAKKKLVSGRRGLARDNLIHLLTDPSFHQLQLQRSHQP